MHAKAMVIGATGGIGRVSSLLMSVAFDELVIVATRVDKLLELRDEIRALSPDTRIIIRTDPDRELSSTEVIVTATSNIDGKILDIARVKPGAVICDCSRPLDISRAEAESRPDVLVIESGEIDLPGALQFTCDIGLPQPSVYACLAETCLLALDGRAESFSLGRHLSLPKVKEIYKLGLKHGARLSAIGGVLGLVTPERLEECRRIAAQNRTRLAETLDQEDK